MKLTLDTDIQYVKGVGPSRGDVLKRMGIINIRRLLYFVPKGATRYLAYKGFQNIGDCEEGDEVIVKGMVTSVETRYTRGRRKMFEVAISDDTGTLLGMWFHVKSYITKAFEEGQDVIFRGKVSIYDQIQITHPQFEIVSGDKEPEVQEHIAKGKIIPVYPETAEFHDRIGQNVFRKIMKNGWDEVKDSFADPIPEQICKEQGLCSIQKMFRFLHFPESKQEIDEGIRRYKFQELFSMELGIARFARSIREKLNKTPVSITEKIDSRIRKRFPFTFTGAQERVIKDISSDMSSDVPMNRLLQGDVGSGKTAVAVYAILSVVANRKQAAFMAPTSILADQHYSTINQLLRDSKVEYRLLSGGMSQSERGTLLEEIESGKVDVVIGTHALVQEDVNFKDLALVIVDEQHKFGVLQRKDLAEKGYNPDILLMTATPIPRTLSMTAYGEYDISIIDEMPPGRSPVKTYWFSEKKRDLGYDIIRERASKGEQVFVVCPLVEESEDLDLKSAVDTHVRLGTQVFPEYNVGLVHGKLKKEEKENIMGRFREGEIDILVATVVVEVGVDIPNASVMVIEHAERFGLAQLHQLRGRIGRGENKSVCILFASGFTESARERIKIMTKTNDGFKIAERDFELRGPGEYFGTRQHGMPSFYLADLAEDKLLLYAARQHAFRIIGEDPDLKKQEHKYCEDLIKRQFSYGVELLGIT